MNNHHLQIHVYCIDGSTHTFVQDEPDAINLTLAELNPAMLFSGERIVVGDGGSAVEFLPPLLARIDLVTDRYSVWDFPFALGAPLELTEAEYAECLCGQKPSEPAGGQGDTPVFLDLQMVNGLQTFLWMEVVGGLQASRLGRIYSLLKERRLVFGLRTGGVGILNLANLAHFDVHPKPPEPVNAVTVSHYASERPRLRLRLAAH